eukprot:gene10296-13841_t
MESVDIDKLLTKFQKDFSEVLIKFSKLSTENIIPHLIEILSKRNYDSILDSNTYKALDFNNFSLSVSYLNIFLVEKFEYNIKHGLCKYIIEVYDRYYNVNNDANSTENNSDEENDTEIDNSNNSNAMIVNTPTKQSQKIIPDNIIIQFQLLHNLKWTKLYQKYYMKALVELAEQYISKLCKNDDFTEKILPNISIWTRNQLKPFAEMIFNDKNLFVVTDEIHKASIDLFTKYRSKVLFEMITDFPDSLPAIKELKETSQYSNNLTFIAKLFRTIVCKRLLHMGASTSQILDFYVSMIKALRVIDSSDLLLNYVAEPIRIYLKSRKDTIRCVVSSLTEGKESELHTELRRGGSLEYGVDEDDEEGGPGENWQPRKKDFELQEDLLGSRGLDILAMLVSIYGSTDLFIIEYRSLLADKLLSNLKYITDQEIGNLELLKIRFGEEYLHSCEVMLKDIEDSKRINNSIQSKTQQAQ